jgi:hypothetical protein
MAARSPVPSAMSVTTAATMAAVSAAGSGHSPPATVDAPLSNSAAGRFSGYAVGGAADDQHAAASTLRNRLAASTSAGSGRSVLPR